MVRSPSQPAGEPRERVADRDALERRSNVDGSLAESHRAAGHRGDELLGVAHHLGHVGAGSIPFEHRELGVVARAELAPTEARGDLVDAAPARREQALHLVLRRRAEPARRPAIAAGHLERVEVHVEARRRNDDRRLHLDESAGVEEPSRPGADGRALAQALHGVV
jgi:hypothetical protein